MPCYQQVENRRFRQRRFNRADIPPDTREVSAGVFHHPFRVFRSAGSLPIVPGQTAGFAVLTVPFSISLRVVTAMRCGFHGSPGGCGFRAG